MRAEVHTCMLLMGDCFCCTTVSCPLLSLARHCIVGQKLTLLQTLTANWAQYNHLTFLRNVRPNRIMHTCSVQRGLFYLQTAQRGSEWSHPDWKFWDLLTLSIKRTRVSLIRPCALINQSPLHVDHSGWKPRCGLVWFPHISFGLIVEEHDSETGLCWLQDVVEMYQLVYLCLTPSY